MGPLIRIKSVQPTRYLENCGVVSGPAKLAFCSWSFPGRRETMLPEKFATHSLPVPEQLETWRHWYGSVFETTTLAQPTSDTFSAENLTWKLDGLAVSRVTAPALSVVRTKTLIRRNPVDHWGITFSKRSGTELKSDDTLLRVPPGVPLIVSLGEEMENRRGADNRLQFYLSRDRFSKIAPLLDAARTTALNTPGAALLGDYMLLLERHLQELPSEEAARLPNAVEAMLAACLAPSAERLAGARRQIDFTLMERVRRVVGKNLRSWTLGPDKLCREAAMSRSQLYRILEGEGGVANYIKRRRLSESFVLLSDISKNETVGKIAEMLCFADASSFSRAFRREFGVSPSDVRATALAGLHPVARPKDPGGSGIHSFADCLCTF